MIKEIGQYVGKRKNNIVIIFVFLALIVAYWPIFMEWYDSNIIPILALFRSNILTMLMTFVLIVICIVDGIKKLSLSYQYNMYMAMLFILATIVLVYYRFFCEDYVFVYCVGRFSYVDAIILLGLFYPIIAIHNRIRCICRKMRKGQEKDEPQDIILDDNPIEDIECDLFDLKDEVLRLENRILALDKTKTWSIAVTAPWGGGKTSFINMIKSREKIKKNFEILTFTPRDCKSVEYIQEDFFSALATLLSKYDSRCDHTLKDYMSSLQLIDNRSIVEKLTKFYRIWNKEDLKLSIGDSISLLNKRILIVIDDFDRLSKGEILEVLKLIDSNAAFNNLVFLTAFDKEQINKLLGESCNTKDACFVDKFFNREILIPYRPYTYISKYIKDKLCKLLKSDNEGLKEIYEVIDGHESLYAEYLPTIRDAIRYINQVTDDYKPVKDEVYIGEFILIELVKYRYPDLHKSIFRGEYTGSNILWGNPNILHLKKDLDNKLPILPILKILFLNDEKSTPPKTYKHIFDKNYFANYFTNRIYNSLRIRDMKEAVRMDWNDAKQKMDEWLLDKDKTDDFIAYLDNYDNDEFFVDKSFSYMRYAESVTYMACKRPQSRAYFLFLKVVFVQNSQLIHDTDKETILDIIKNTNVTCDLISRLHAEYKLGWIREDDYFIKDDYIWPFVKEKFIQNATSRVINEEAAYLWLLKCVDYKEKQTDKVHLDQDCLMAYRERVENNPTYYIDNFVRLGSVSSSLEFNSIACEPYWKQIFGDYSRFEKLLNRCKENNVENIDRVLNFWELYKANGFEPIQFQNQGDVQEKIDNDLVEEVKKLDELKKIGKEVQELPNEKSTIQELEKLRNELDGIKLDIKLRVDIRSCLINKINI